MTAIKWYAMTHDRTGSRYGWIIAKESGKDLVIYSKGYSRERFLSVAEMIISSASDPTGFLVINPAEKGTAYKMTSVFYAARHSGYASIEKAFSIA